MADSLNCQTPVVVGAADVEGVRLTLAPGAEIRRLQVATEGDEKPDLSGIRIGLTANGRRYSVDSTYGSGGVRPDHYLVRFYGSLLRQYYVRSARAGETDVLADGLTVSGAGSIQIVIVLASDGAKVEGVVRNANQEPAPGATVVLAPRYSHGTMSSRRSGTIPTSSRSTKNKARRRHWKIRGILQSFSRFCSLFRH